MTRDQKKANIGAEVARGDGSLASAEILLTAGQLADAVSRAYYAVFHYCRALLLTVGEEAKTHAGLERLVQRDLVRTGKLAPETASVLSRLMTYRQNADYMAEYVFTEAMAREQVDAARAFVGQARGILSSDGWLAE